MHGTWSRRGFLGASLGGSIGLSMAGALGIATPGAARAQQFPPLPAGLDDPDAVLLNFNENPHGPFPEALRAAADSLPRAGRYLFQRQRALAELFAAQNALAPDQVALLAGSGVGLDQAALAFTAKDRALVLPDPSFESIAQMADAHGRPLRRVPLLADGAHDVEAMAAADPGAGLLYVCNPNNPTGTVTPRARIDWLLANKPAGSVVLVDEAYIHFCDEPDTLDLVRAGADLVVLRTFSKIYGMAGMRLGIAIARPDLLARLMAFGGNSLPVPTIAAGMTSLQRPERVAERKRANADTLAHTLSWLRARGHACTEAKANCFMVDVGRPGRDFAQAMAARKVFVGRSWPIWPNHVRVTVGTPEDMRRFREAFAQVLSA